VNNLNSYADPSRNSCFETVLLSPENILSVVTDFPVTTPFGDGRNGDGRLIENKGLMLFPGVANYIFNLLNHLGVAVVSPPLATAGIASVLIAVRPSKSVFAWSCSLFPL
jgi:hypothetical protein